MTSQFLNEFLCFKELYAIKTYVRKNIRKQKTVRLIQTQIYLPIIFNIPLRIVNKKLGKVLTFKKT